MTLIDRLRPALHIAPVKPAIAAGFRAGVATVLPLIVGHLLGWPDQSWMALGGFLTALADKGGAYRVRATTTAAVALTAALGALVGAAASSYPALAIPLMFCWVTMCGLVRVFGAGATSVGISSAIIFAASLATPVAPAHYAHEVWQRAAVVLGGGAWAMALSLLLWPVRYYRPARHAVAACYRALADHANQIAKLAEFSSEAATNTIPDSIRQTLFQQSPAAIRESIETARAILATTRRGRHAESGRGDRLLVLLEGADQLFAIGVSIADVLDVARAADVPTARAVVRHTITEYARTIHALATRIELEQDESDSTPLPWGADTLHVVLDSRGDMMPPFARAQYEYAATLLARLREMTEVVVSTASTLNTDRPIPEGIDPHAPVVQPIPRLAPLRDALTFNSVVLRHALRLGITAAVAVWVTTHFGLPHGYWVTLTTIVILQPYTTDTILKALQRVAGTVVGAILAALMVAALPNFQALLPVIFVLAVVGVSVMPINYGVYSVFITCTFVLLAELGVRDPHLAEARILNTIIGGLLALLGARLLWPSSERTHFPQYMAEALRGSRAYLRRVVAICMGREQAGSALLAGTRRQAGLAIINAEASFQRLVAESSDRAAQVEPAMAMLLYTRRFNSAITALGSAPWTDAQSEWRERLPMVERLADTVLENISDAVAHGTQPAPLPDLTAMLPSATDRVSTLTSEYTIAAAATGENATSDMLFRTRLERIARQLGVLHGTVARFHNAL